MTTQEIATKLADYCSRGEYEKAQRELYADDVISIEPEESPGFKKEEKGLDNIIEKGHKFDAMVETLHSVYVSEPLVAGNVFTFTITMDITMKKHGRSTIAEICVYKVKDGKVISEHFFM